MEHVLACIDGSIFSESVCDHAVWAADRLQAPVSVIHVIDREDHHVRNANLSGNLGWGEHESLLEEFTELDEQRSRITQKRSRLILDRASERIREAGISEVRSRQRQGELVDTISELEPDAQLVVIGKRGEGADEASPHLGRNLERVVRAAKKPVLVTTREFQPINHFVIAFDDGPSARRAVNTIARLPLLSGIKCTLLMVGQDTPIAGQQLHEAGETLRKAGFDVDETVIPGVTEDVIMTTINERNIDLLVMGAYNHSRLRSLIIGSTTNALLRSTRVPVLLFRSGPE
jgi:nucleotide-binding universal stress UspA family protein